MLRGKAEPNWRVMKRLEKSLLREFGAQGIRSIEFVIAFSEPFTFWVWLGSATDAEREQLQADARGQRAHPCPSSEPFDRCALRRLDHRVAGDGRSRLPRELVLPAEVSLPIRATRHERAHSPRQMRTFDSHSVVVSTGASQWGEVRTPDRFVPKHSRHPRVHAFEAAAARVPVGYSPLRSARVGVGCRSL
jgi:hypothetical protein